MVKLTLNQKLELVNNSQQDLGVMIGVNPLAYSYVVDLIREDIDDHRDDNTEYN